MTITKANDLKVAIQLFGHVRSFRDTYPFLEKNILTQYDCDLFIHTWSTEEHSDPTWHQGSPDNVKKTSIEEVESLYKPKKILIEDNDKIEHEGLFHPDKSMTLRAIKAMLYSQEKVNLLRLEHQEEVTTTYDWVVTLRPDIMPLTVLDLAQFNNECTFDSKTSIHFSNGAHCHLQGTKNIYTPLASDLFVVAKPKNMNVICSAVNEFEKYFVQFSTVNKGGISAPEASYIEYICRQGIQPRFYTFPYVVKRTLGNHHLVVGLEHRSCFKHPVEIPDFLNIENSRRGKSIVLHYLSTSLLCKIQKETHRLIRHLGRFIDHVEAVKSSK
ncbi:hypothetical protein [Vibrio sp. ER1A]|uniref:hypothetical protein n=1 Tax=Vibrio sp. ER1A TaxID=1517681 RepID=UPI0004DD1658|nr:hypothetical protein [Vibrio sp. ER1A]KFA95192.1 hypothetical protein HW45_27295 [Vibrio sp. ER1A]